MAEVGVKPLIDVRTDPKSHHLALIFDFAGQQNEDMSDDSEEVCNETSIEVSDH